jgi:hypothetical protein
VNIRRGTDGHLSGQILRISEYTQRDCSMDGVERKVCRHPVLNIVILRDWYVNLMES